MHAPAAYVAMLAAALTAQDPVPGIDLGMARARAALVSDVHCALHFTLDHGATAVRGETTLRFRLPDRLPAQPLVLDFAGTDLADVRVNGQDPGTGMRAVADHLLLAPALLRAGQNEFAASFRSPVAATGTALSVYHDPTDGRDFYYTLVVPADAHRLYPCFDQPDLKATFTLQLELPAEWTALANGAEAEPPRLDGPRRHWRFRETRPISTYLLAFCCGQFDVVLGPELRVLGIEPGQPLRILLRPSQRRHLDREALVRLHDDGLRWLADQFGVPYPFGKLDVALIPGFPYGGMEHAGAIFYREQALLFDHPPTDSELARRSTLVYHELSHQWFGNLVTMKWFDDLWLKEGFATFIGYQAMAALEPQRSAWLRFQQRIKPRAYEVDGTPGTVPVFQSLQNLADAKSAYGPIVYDKAPAVLRELHERLGAKAFRAGLQHYLQAHAFGNADWRDLAGALESAAATDLRRWSDRWLLTASMPQVRVDWQVDGNGVVDGATLRQHAIDGAGAWPLRLQLLVIDLAGGRRLVAVDTEATACTIDALIGHAAPACVLPNPGDIAYGQFVPDAVSRDWLLTHAPRERDPLLRAVMTASLFEAVRVLELDPAAFAALLLELLAGERDPDTHAFLLEPLATCLERYLPAERAAPLQARAHALLLHQLAHEGGSGRELQTFRFLARYSRHPEVLRLCRAVAHDQPLPAGLVPGKQDRYLAAAALLAAGAAADELAALQRQFAGEDTGKEAFLARAAAPDPAVKQDYWRQYLQLGSPPEQWTQDSLGWFHWPRQEALTLPYLRLALEQVDWVKANRKIFFMPAWIDGFVNGHSSAAAFEMVRTFVERPMAGDLRQKLLQSLDGLERAVAIRAAWPAAR